MWAATDDRMLGCSNHSYDMDGACGTHEEMGNALKCTQKNRREGNFGIHRHKWHNSINMDNK
jgi:hypothetical protein